MSKVVDVYTDTCATNRVYVYHSRISAVSCGWCTIVYFITQSRLKVKTTVHILLHSAPRQRKPSFKQQQCLKLGRMSGRFVFASLLFERTCRY
jgi:hypothetical protein